MQLQNIIATALLAGTSLAAPASSSSKASAAQPAGVAINPNPVPSHAFHINAAIDSVQAILSAHNVHRSNHSASAMTWNTSLAADARDIANSCIFQHTHPGQNLAAGYSSVVDAVHNGWYNNEMPNYAPYYGQANVPSNVFGSVGHFTQVVWKGSTSVGCASAKCNTVYGSMQVCNYWPYGNYGGQFGTNVGRPLGAATVKS